MADEIVASEGRKRLTEQDQRAAGQSMVSAAFVALGEYSDELGQDQMARRFLRAMFAAKHARKNEEELRGARIEDTSDRAAATAYWFWVNGGALPNDCCADSGAAAILLGLAQGVYAARAASEVISAFDDGWDWEVYDDGLDILAPKLVAEEGGAK